MDWEPVVGVDLTSDKVYQLATRYYAPACPSCPDGAIVFRRSTDQGRSWGDDLYIDNVGAWQADPQVQVANDGTVFVAYMREFTPGVMLIKSTDGGVTWSTPVATVGSPPSTWSDHPLLIISADGRDVYIAFSASDSYIVASHDYGGSFAAPIKTNFGRRYWFHTGGVVASNGDVYFAAIDYSQTYAGESNIQILKSRDGGGSWTTHLVDTSKEMPSCGWAPGCYFGFFAPTASLAINVSGTLMIAYNLGKRSSFPQSIWWRTSADGVDWSRRRRVPRRATNANHAFPVLASGPAAGDFRLAWQDDSKTPTEHWNTWYRRTADGGVKWSRSVRISDRAALTVYKHRRGYSFPYGDYFFMSVDIDGKAHVIWGEGQSLEGNGGVWYSRER